MINIRYQLYCTQCSREYKEEQFDSMDDVLKYYPKNWVRKKVLNGSDWDFCPKCIVNKKELIAEILEKLGLYQNDDWVPFEAVIKLKSNDLTILVKQDGNWEWYNKKYFDEINADQDDKDELLSFWMPIDGKEDEIV